MSVCGIRCEAYYVYIASTLLQGTQIIQSLRKANTAKYRWCRKTVCHGFCKSHVAPHTESFFAPTSVLNGGWAIPACFIPQSWKKVISQSVCRLVFKDSTCVPLATSVLQYLRRSLLCATGHQHTHATWFTSLYSHTRHVHGSSVCVFFHVSSYAGF